MPLSFGRSKIKSKLSTQPGDKSSAETEHSQTSGKSNPSITVCSTTVKSDQASVDRKSTSKKHEETARSIIKLKGLSRTSLGRSKSAVKSVPPPRLYSSKQNSSPPGVSTSSTGNLRDKSYADTTISQPSSSSTMVTFQSHLPTKVWQASPNPSPPDNHYQPSKQMACDKTAENSCRHKHRSKNSGKAETLIEDSKESRRFSRANAEYHRSVNYCLNSSTKANKDQTHPENLHARSYSQRRHHHKSHQHHQRCRHRHHHHHHHHPLHQQYQQHKNKIARRWSDANSSEEDSRHTGRHVDQDNEDEISRSSYAGGSGDSRLGPRTGSCLSLGVTSGIFSTSCSSTSSSTTSSGDVSAEDGSGSGSASSSISFPPGFNQNSGGTAIRIGHNASKGHSLLQLSGSTSSSSSSSRCHRSGAGKTRHSCTISSSSSANSSRCRNKIRNGSASSSSSSSIASIEEIRLHHQKRGLRRKEKYCKQPTRQNDVLNSKHFQRRSGEAKPSGQKCAHFVNRNTLSTSESNSSLDASCVHLSGLVTLDQALPTKQTDTPNSAAQFFIDQLISNSSCSAATVQRKSSSIKNLHQHLQNQQCLDQNLHQFKQYPRKNSVGSTDYASYKSHATTNRDIIDGDYRKLVVESSTTVLGSSLLSSPPSSIAQPLGQSGGMADGGFMPNFVWTQPSTYASDEKNVISNGVEELGLIRISQNLTCPLSETVMQGRVSFYPNEAKSRGLLHLHNSDLSTEPTFDFIQQTGSIYSNNHSLSPLLSTPQLSQKSMPLTVNLGQTCSGVPAQTNLASQLPVVNQAHEFRFNKLQKYPYTCRVTRRLVPEVQQRVDVQSDSPQRHQSFVASGSNLAQEGRKEATMSETQSGQTASQHFGVQQYQRFGVNSLFDYSNGLVLQGLNGNSNGAAIHQFASLQPHQAGLRVQGSSNVLAQILHDFTPSSEWREKYRVLKVCRGDLVCILSRPPSGRGMSELSTNTVQSKESEKSEVHRQHAFADVAASGTNISSCSSLNSSSGNSSSVLSSTVSSASSGSNKICNKVESRQRTDLSTSSLVHSWLFVRPWCSDHMTATSQAGFVPGQFCRLLTISEVAQQMNARQHTQPGVNVVKSLGADETSNLATPPNSVTCRVPNSCALNKDSGSISTTSSSGLGGGHNDYHDSLASSSAQSNSSDSQHAKVSHTNEGATGVKEYIIAPNKSNPTNILTACSNSTSLTISNFDAASTVSASEIQGTRSDGVNGSSSSNICNVAATMQPRTEQQIPKYQTKCDSLLTPKGVPVNSAQLVNNKHGTNKNHSTRSSANTASSILATNITCAMTSCIGADSLRMNSRRGSTKSNSSCTSNGSSENSKTEVAGQTGLYPVITDSSIAKFLNTENIVKNYNQNATVGINDLHGMSIAHVPMKPFMSSFGAHQLVCQENATGQTPVGHYTDDTLIEPLQIRTTASLNNKTCLLNCEKSITQNTASPCPVSVLSDSEQPDMTSVGCFVDVTVAEDTQPMCSEETEDRDSGRGPSSGSEWGSGRGGSSTEATQRLSTGTSMLCGIEEQASPITVGHLSQLHSYNHLQQHQSSTAYNSLQREDQETSHMYCPLGSATFPEPQIISCHASNFNTHSIINTPGDSNFHHPRESISFLPCDKYHIVDSPHQSNPLCADGTTFNGQEMTAETLRNMGALPLPLPPEPPLAVLSSCSNMVQFLAQPHFHSINAPPESNEFASLEFNRCKANGGYSTALTNCDANFICNDLTNSLPRLQLNPHSAYISICSSAMTADSNDTTSVSVAGNSYFPLYVKPIGLPLYDKEPGAAQGSDSRPIASKMEDSIARELTQISLTETSAYGQTLPVNHTNNVSTIDCKEVNPIKDTQDTINNRKSDEFSEAESSSNRTGEDSPPTLVPPNSNPALWEPYKTMLQVGQYSLEKFTLV